MTIVSYTPVHERAGRSRIGCLVSGLRGEQEMVPESDNAATTPADTDVPAGDLDNDVKKIHEQIRTRGEDVPEYIRILKSGGLIERRKSAEALGEIGDERGVLPLIDATQDPSFDVRYVAIKSLGMLGDRRAVDTLIGALKSDEKWLRLGAAHSLGHIGDVKAVEFLIPLLNDPHHDVRAHVAWALGMIGDARAVAPLQQLVQDPREDVRREVKTALDALGMKSP